jgi:hypothetical protein
LLRYEILSVSSLRNRRFYFFIIGLEPDGCLVADQLRIRTKKFEITGAGTEKELTPLLEDVPAKKNCSFFCDGEVFFLDRVLLMGANSSTFQLFVIFTNRVWLS